jgi:hypothetical protein
MSHSCISLDLITLRTVGEKFKLRSSAVCRFLRLSCTSPLLDPTLPLGTLLTNTRYLLSSLRARDNVSYPYK